MFSLSALPDLLDDIREPASHQAAEIAGGRQHLKADLSGGDSNAVIVPGAVVEHGLSLIHI